MLVGNPDSQIMDLLSYMIFLDINLVSRTKFMADICDLESIHEKVKKRFDTLD